MICNHLYNVLKMVNCVRTTEKKKFNHLHPEKLKCMQVESFSACKHFFNNLT